MTKFSPLVELPYSQLGDGRQVAKPSSAEEAHRSSSLAAAATPAA